MEPGDALATNVQSPMLGEVLARIELPETPEQQRPDGGHGGHMAPGGAQEDAPELGPEVEYEPIPVTRDVVLLDVGPSVNANGETVAYLREETGAIVNRDPEAESRKQIFMVVQGSAQRGEEALKPKEMAAPPRGPRPEPAPRPGQRDPDSPMSPTSPSGPGGG
jgi:hypothetical protein